MPRLVLALALLTAALGLRFGTFAASGADSYGYVSQAALWLERTLIIDEPLADEAPWRNANWTLTPLGYRPGDRRGTMVPTYSPGLPIVMAALKAVGGRDAPFYAVPLFGALAVWLTYRLGVRLAGQAAGILAAVALVFSPVFLFQLMWPMSDVPVMTWWLLSIVLALRGTTPGAAGAGLAAAAAILTRPNLAVLALPGLLCVIGRPAARRLWHGCIFTIAMLPGPIAVAALNAHLYGSALASGYGTFSTIYTTANVATNLVNYVRWMLQTQTPFIMLALAAPVLFRRRDNSSAYSVSLVCLVFSAVVWLSYLWYTAFDDWTYLRFLLPAYPPLLAVAAAVFVSVLPPAPRTRAAAIGLMAVALAGWGLWMGRSAFDVRRQEARYIAAGRFAADLPANAVILCNQHSGSLRYYANRITMRFEWLDPDMYDEAIAYLRRRGHPVYVVLDDWERDIFRARYSRVADVSWLDRPPLVVAADRVYFYALPANGRPGYAGL